MVSRGCNGSLLTTDGSLFSEELELREGADVYLAFKASAVHLIPKSASQRT